MELVNWPIHGTLSLEADGGFTYEPLTNYVGPDTFIYQAFNGTTNLGFATVTILITSDSILFSDDFARLADPGSLWPWVAQSGDWVVTQGLLEAGQYTLQSWLHVYVTNNWANYSVEGRIGLASPNVSGGGIGGRLNPATGARYAAWVYPEGSAVGSNVLRLIKFQTWSEFSYKGAGGAPMAEAALAAVGTNWHRLKLAFSDNQIAVYYDGDLMISVADGEVAGYASGGVSVETLASLVGSPLSVDEVVVRPLVIDDTYSITQETTLRVADPGVLANDTGVYATNVVTVLVSGPTNGTLDLDSKGGFSYRPATDYNGPDGFGYQASQGGTSLGTGKVMIAVIAPDAPLLVSSPFSCTNDAGTTAVLSAKALGTLPLSYQWLRNGTNALNDGAKISGSRSATLTISNVLGGDAGSYTVVVSNALGRVTSAPPAVLTVVDPIITSQPLDQTNAAGTFAAFGVGAYGTSPGYQWFKDGGRISGATNGALVFATVSEGDAGSYMVVITNRYGSVTSRVAQLVFVPEPAVESVRMTNGTAVITWGSVAGQSYQLQFKEGLGSTNWQDALPAITAAGTKTTVTNSLGSALQRFYRIILAPPAVPPLVITSIRISGGSAVVTWNSVAGQKYWLQYKDSIGDAIWQDALPELTAAGSITSATNKLEGAKKRFYRVSLAPAAPPPFVITSIRAVNGFAVITWNSVAGQTYRLRYKNSLSDTDWQTVLPEIIATGSTTTATNLLGGAAQRFYRVELVTVVPPPFVITSIRLTNSVAVITWNSVAGQVYRVQYKSRLTDQAWQDALPDVLATGSTTTLTNALGGATSRFYRVTLVQGGAGRPLIRSISKSNGVVTVVWSSVLNQGYRLQFKSNLSDANWLNVAPDVVATGPATAMTDAAGSSARRYYRVVLVP